MKGAFKELHVRKMGGPKLIARDLCISSLKEPLATFAAKTSYYVYYPHYHEKKQGSIWQTLEIVAEFLSGDPMMLICSKVEYVYMFTVNPKYYFRANFGY